MIRYSYTKLSNFQCIIVFIFILFGYLYSDENIPDHPKVIAGFKGGLSYSNFTTDENYIYDPEFTRCFSYGGFLNFDISKYFSLQIEVNYVEKGSEGFEDFFEFYESETSWHPGYYFKEKVLYDFKLKYTAIPIFVKYHPLEIYKIKPNLYCGLSLAVNFDSRMNVIDGGISEFLSVEEGEQDIDDLIKDKDYNAIFGIGLDYRLYNFNIFLDMRYNLGLSEIFEEDEFNYKYMNSVFITSIGFGYILNPSKKSSNRMPRRDYK